MQKTKIVFAYKAGFRRLWLVISAFLLAVMSLIAWDHPQARDIMIWGAVVPIVSLYLLGVAFVWVIEGFARADR